MGPVAERWLSDFLSKHADYKDAAEIARSEIEAALQGRPISIHSIVARAKAPHSARDKIHRKGYGRPARQMTDVLGVRVITSSAAHIEAVVARLRDKFVVDEKNFGPGIQVSVVDRHGATEKAYRASAGPLSCGVGDGHLLNSELEAEVYGRWQA